MKGLDEATLRNTSSRSVDPVMKRRHTEGEKDGGSFDKEADALIEKSFNEYLREVQDEMEIQRKMKEEDEDDAYKLVAGRVADINLDLNNEHLNTDFI